MADAYLSVVGTLKNVCIFWKKMECFKPRQTSFCRRMYRPSGFSQDIVCVLVFLAHIRLWYECTFSGLWTFYSVLVVLILDVLPLWSYPSAICVSYPTSRHTHCTIFKMIVSILLTNVSWYFSYHTLMLNLSSSLFSRFWFKVTHNMMRENIYRIFTYKNIPIVKTTEVCFFPPKNLYITMALEASTISLSSA